MTLMQHLLHSLLLSDKWTMRQDDDTYATLASQLSDMAALHKNPIANKQGVSSVNTFESSDLLVQCAYCSGEHVFNECPGNQNMLIILAIIITLDLFHQLTILDGNNIQI